MVNFYENTLIISGEQNEISTFILNNSCQFTSNLLSFSNIIPQPHYMTEEQIYKWRLKNWGSDSEPTIINIIKENDKIKYIFRTYRGTPIPWIKRVSSIYINLHYTLIFRENSTGFMGNISCYRGQTYYLEEFYLSEWIWDNNICKEDIYKLFMITIKSFYNYSTIIHMKLKRKYTNISTSSINIIMDYYNSIKNDDLDFDESIKLIHTDKYFLPFILQFTKSLSYYKNKQISNNPLYKILYNKIDEYLYIQNGINLTDVYTYIEKYLEEKLDVYVKKIY